MFPLPVEAMTKCWPLSISDPPLTVELIVAPVPEMALNAGPKLRAMVQFCTEMVMFALLVPANRMPCALVVEPGHVVLANVLLLIVRLIAVLVAFWTFSCREALSWEFTALQVRVPNR